MKDSNGKRVCPGCVGHSEREQLEATGMVLSALEAMLSTDDDLVTLTANQLSQLEAHKAVTLLGMQVLLVCKMTGMTPEAYVGQMRKGVNEALAKAV